MNQWLDLSLRLLSVLDQCHSNLWIKNGDVFTQGMYNYERSDFNYIFYGVHFSLIQSVATKLVSPSNLLTLILHRYRLHNWFADNNAIDIVSPSGSSGPNQTNVNVRDLTDPTESGWASWMDSERTLKMVTYVLHLFISMISEPTYCLLLDDPKDDTLQRQYGALIRYEVVQWLVLSPMSMSGLVYKVYADNENTTENELKLRRILGEVADFEAPSSMEDTGKFKLKSTYFAHFNPFYKKYGRFFSGFANATDEQSEATDRYLKVTAKATQQGEDKVMFPNWPTSLLAHSSDPQLALLTVPYMGLMWNCTLYHVYVNDGTRFTVDHLQECLRLISMAIQVMFCDFCP